MSHLSLEFPRIFNGMKRRSLDLFGIKRGILLGVVLLLGGSWATLWSALWMELNLVEQEILQKAEKIDFPSIVDGMTSPLDNVMEVYLEEAQALSEREYLKDWVHQLTSVGGIAEKRLSFFVESALKQRGFDRAALFLPGNLGIWFYEKGVFSVVPEGQDHPIYDFLYQNMVRDKTYQVDFLPEGDDGAGELWFTIPLARDGLGQDWGIGGGKLVVSVGVKKIRKKMQSTEARRGKFQFPRELSAFGNNNIMLLVVEPKGRVVLSDQEDKIGAVVYDFMPAAIRDHFLLHIADSDRLVHSHTVVDAAGESIQLVHYPILSGSMEVIVAIPHRYVVGFINKLRVNTIFLSLCLLFVIAFCSYLIYRYIINPEYLVRQAKRKISTAVHERGKVLEKIANFDSLTKVHTRRYFDYAARLSRAHCRAEKQPLTLIFIDVDFFKNYNDALGHVAGDSCLQQIAALLKQGCHRSHDLVARYGGEEFVVLLPETALEGGLAIAERLRHAVEQAALPHPCSAVASVVTVSIGVTTMTADSKIMPKQLLEQADTALYQAKKNGRNQVCVG